MSFSMSKASLPVFDISLNALSAILDKAEAHAAAKKVDSSVLLHSRLSPDMFALVRQVQITPLVPRMAVNPGIRPAILVHGHVKFLGTHAEGMHDVIPAHPAHLDAGGDR